MICKKWRLDLPKIPTQISFTALSKGKIKALNVCTKPNYEFASISSGWRFMALTGKNQNAKQTHYFQEVEQGQLLGPNSGERMHMTLLTVLGFANRKKKRDIECEEKRTTANKRFFGQNLGAILGKRELGWAKGGNEAGVPACFLFLKPREWKDRATKFFLSAWLFLSLPGNFQH